MESFTNNNRLTLTQMMLKLEQMREEQDNIIEKTKILKLRYEQLEEDIDMLNTMVMYQSNKDAREKQQRKVFNFNQ